MPEEVDRAPLILSFRDPRCSEPALAGGKGASLARCAAWGLPVPEGFVVTAAACRLFLDSLAGAAPEGEETVASRIESAPLPEELERALLEAYRALGGGPVSVRSSATAEDLAEASFAGQYETFLFVEGEKTLLDHVRRCCASLFAPAALEYRRSRGLEGLESEIAVVVQQMIDAEAAGVMFTANHLTGWAGEIRIEGAWGLGEGLVSGRVQPDLFLLRKRDLSVIEKTIAEKTAKTVRSSAGGTALIRVAEALTARPCLEEEELKALCALGLEAEKRYGAPQDIEWAVKGGKVWLLQSRPITTLPSPEEDTWTRLFGDEYWADITTPLFFSLLGDWIEIENFQKMYRRQGLRDVVGIKILKRHRGHVYFNSRFVREMIKYTPQGAREDGTLGWLASWELEEVRDTPLRKGRFVMAILRTQVFGRESRIDYNHRRLYQYGAWLERRLGALRLDELPTLSEDEIVTLSNRLYGLGLLHFRIIRWGLSLHNVGLNMLLRRLLQDWAGEEDESAFQTLVSGLTGNYTIQTNQALFELCRRTEAELPGAARIIAEKTSDEALLDLALDEEGRRFLALLEEFLGNYGHRGSTREIYAPRWRDDPTLVLNILKSLLRAGENPSPAEIEARKATEREELEKAVLEKVKKNKGRVKAAFFRRIMSYAQTYCLYRENQRFFLDRTLHACRLTFIEMGRRYAARGLLADAEDVFFLTRQEALSALAGSAEAPSPAGLAELILDRRREYRENRDRLPPSFIRGRLEFEDDRRAPAEGQPQERNVLRGLAVSHGVYSGPARVLSSVRDLHRVKKGDILIASNTDPGWTPVFVLLGGLVLETGGTLAHGAILAREYGAPAVTAVTGATRLIRDGQQITVDGSRGLVRLDG